MSQLTEKELSVLNDALSEEELLVKKFQMLAEQSQDPQMKSAFQDISGKHQGHFNSLYEQLRG
jgi:rubrerythrin